MDSRRNHPEPLIPKHGGYRNLKTFQLAQLVYDLTVRFCDRYIDRRSRTHDQMVQAARSGVQNIAEGSLASATSKKTELKLTNVARASLGELSLDYQDYLRQHALREWTRDDPRRTELVKRRFTTADAVVLWVHEVHQRSVYGPSGQCGHGGHGGHGRQNIGLSTESTASTLSTLSISSYPEIAANAALTIITVTCTLLARQIAAQAAAFEQEGGFTERLYRVRSDRRSRDR